MDFEPMIDQERDSFGIMDSRDLVEDQEFDQEDKSMEHTNSQLAALTLEELPHTDSGSKRRFGEPMEEIFAFKRLKIADGESMPDQYHVTPQKELADAREADLELDVYNDGDDDQDSGIASKSSSSVGDNTENGDDISEWLVTFLKAVLDDNEDEEETFLNFKEKRRQFRKRVNRCLAEALGSGNDDVGSSNEEVSDEEDEIILSDDNDDKILDEDDIIFTDEDDEGVSDKDVEEISVEDGEEIPDEDDDIFCDEEDDYFADEDDNNNNNNDY